MFQLRRLALGAVCALMPAAAPLAVQMRQDSLVSRRGIARSHCRELASPTNADQAQQNALIVSLAQVLRLAAYLWTPT
jgi:hypothetical protein